jgi:hypothetical protein
VTDHNSSEVQLHAYSLLSKGRFHLGDRVRFARLEGPEVHHSDAPPLGWVGVIDEDDGSTGLPFRVTGGAWPRGYRSENAWWFAPEALERVEAAMT